MKKTMIMLALAAMTATGAVAQTAAEDGTRSFTVGNFDNPGDEEAKIGEGSWWEFAPFQFYTRYSGIQIIYGADFLTPLAEDNGSVTEVVFKYGDNGSTVEVLADLKLYIENTDQDEFQKKPGTDNYMWIDYDPSTSYCNIPDYYVELYYYEDEEIHFVLDKPLPYTGKNLLITAWSDRLNDGEAQARVSYCVKTRGYTVMEMGSDRYGFEKVYDTGIQEDYQGPNKFVPVAKFVYTVGDGIGSVDADTSDAAPVLYNLQGQVVDGRPAPGLYIRKQGSEARKVIIR